MSESSLFEGEMIIRLSAFIGVLALLALLELILPRKKRVLPRQQRWLTNLGMVIIDIVAVRLVVPVATVGMALILENKGWGLFNLVDLPTGFELIASIILLDMLIYWQHVLTHRIPVLWAVHRVHHSDRDFDVTTGIRFHPIEIVLSMFYKLLCIVVIGPAVIAVFIFELWLNVGAMFSHADIALPRKIDRIVRRLIVTPDMHRVHHSVYGREINSNYGFGLSLWDRLFGTYIDQPTDGHNDMVIGLRSQQSDKPASLSWCLLWPFKWFSERK